MSRWRDGDLVSRGIDFSQLRATEENLLMTGRSSNTQRAYRASWKAFEVWAAWAGLAAHPADNSTVRLFVVWCIEQQAYRLSTIRLHLAAIRAKHLDTGVCSPVDARVWHLVHGASRRLRQKPEKKAAFTADLLRGISEALSKDPRPISVRDRAIVLCGFAAGWRRSELVSLDLANIEFAPEGVLLVLGASKTDQDGKRGRAAGIAYGNNIVTCPVTALREWLAMRGTAEGPLFSSLRSRRLPPSRLAPGTINGCIKRALALAGVNSALYSAHSLRSGMITAAVHNGASLAAIMERSGHSSVQTLMDYVRPAHAFRFDPLAGVL